jgi:hypothetical protein
VTWIFELSVEDSVEEFGGCDAFCPCSVAEAITVVVADAELGGLGGGGVSGGGHQTGQVVV